LRKRKGHQVRAKARKRVERVEEPVKAIRGVKCGWSATQTKKKGSRKKIDDYKTATKR